MAFELQHDAVDAFLAQRFEADSFCARVQSFVRLWFSAAPILQESSGSTGKPKLFRLDRAAMRASARMTCSYFKLGRGDRALLCLPVEYIAGKMMVVRALEAGLRLRLVAPRANPLAALDTPVDFAAMVPSQVQAALEALDRVGQLLIGGAPTPASLQAALQSKRTRCWATYGMTETLSHVALRPLDGADPQAPYQALSGIRFTTDQRSCLVVQAPALGIDRLVTNDVVTLHSETAFHWLGRSDHVINSGGVKLFPERIEEKLSPHFSARFFIAKQPDDRWGERPILVVEGAPFKVEKSRLQRLGLTPYELPKAVYFLHRFVETPSGKVQRGQTLERLTQAGSQGVAL